MRPKYRGDWESATRFPVGLRFVGGVIGSKLVLWGGTQRQQQDGEKQLLPSNFVYTFIPPGLSDNAKGAWKKIPKIGDVHPNRNKAAFTTLNNLIYIFGGFKRRKYKNTITSLSADGKFTI